MVTATRTPRRRAGRSERHDLLRRGSRRAPARRSSPICSRRTWRDADAQRRCRDRHITVRARRRKRLQQGAPRRHAAQRARRHVLFRQPDDREPRANRNRPRRTVCAVWVRRDGERHPAVHAARRRRQKAGGIRLRSRAAVTARSGRAPRRQDAPVRSITVSEPHASSTNNRVPNSDFDNTTVSANVGRVVRSGCHAALRRTRRIRPQRNSGADSFRSTGSRCVWCATRRRGRRLLRSADDNARATARELFDRRLPAAGDEPDDGSRVHGDLRRPHRTV